MSCSSSSSTGKGTVVVGGGTGFVGSEVCALFKRKGYRVVVVSRNPGLTGSNTITWNDLEADGLPNGTKAVVNVAGQNVLDPFKRWNPAFQKLVTESRLGTARALRKAIEKCDVSRAPSAFVQITGVACYIPDNDHVYDESSSLVLPEIGNGAFMSRLVSEWEKEATLEDGCPTRTVLIRSGVVLGRNGGMISQIFLPFYFGGGGRMGSGNQPMPWIHVKDLAGLIMFSAENENVAGVLNGVSPQIITNSEFVEAFSSALCRPAFFPLPDFVWNTVFGEDRAAIVTQGQKVLPKRTLAFGYDFRFPTIREACKELAHLFYEDPDSLQ